MIFNRYMWKHTAEGFLVKDCTIGFEDGRIGFLFVEEGNSHVRSDWWETKLVAVKLDLSADKRFYVRKGGNLRIATLSSAWAPNQSEFVVVDTSRSVWSYKPKEYKGSEDPVPFATHGINMPQQCLK